MKPLSAKVITLLFIFLIPFTSDAQEGSYFDGNATFGLCPYDSSLSLYLLDNFDVYQTEDDLYDGVVIEQCILITKQSGRYQISTKDLAIEKPLFVRLKKKNLPLILEPNTAFKFFHSIRSNDGLFANSPDCSVDSCNTLTLITSLPNFANDGFVDRIKKYNLETFDTGTFDEICMTSQNLINQTIKDIYLTIYLEKNPNNGDEFNIFNLGHRNVEADLMAQDFFIRDELLIGDLAKLSVQDLAPGNTVTTITVHTNGYPSQSNKDVKSLLFSNNPSSKKKVIVKVDFPHSILFQDFTSLGTGLVEGSDSVYHDFELELNNGEICLDFIDLVINNGGSFRYVNGGLTLNGEEACMNFKNESTFVINRKSQLYYGLNGIGMLGLKNGRVVLEEGAELTIDSKILLQGRYGKYSNIKLSEGSRLRFTPNVSFILKDDLNEKLFIYGYRYQIDFNGMSPTEKDKIVIIEPEKNKIDQLITYPNPIINQVYLKGNHHLQKYQILDYAGRTASAGIVNNNTISCENLHQGIYLLKVGNQWAKIIKQ